MPDHATTTSPKKNIASTCTLKTMKRLRKRATTLKQEPDMYVHVHVHSKSSLSLYPTVKCQMAPKGGIFGTHTQNTGIAGLKNQSTFCRASLLSSASSRLGPHNQLRSLQRISQVSSSISLTQVRTSQS